MLGKQKSTDPTKLSVSLRNKLTEESEKFGESLKNTVLGESKSDESSSFIHDLLTQGGKVNPKIDDREREDIIREDKKRLAELEEEIRRYQVQRTESISQYSGNIQSEFDKGKNLAQDEPLVMPKGKKHGARGPGAAGKSKGSGEMLKSKK